MCWIRSSNCWRVVTWAIKKNLDEKGRACEKGRSLCRSVKKMFFKRTAAKKSEKFQQLTQGEVSVVNCNNFQTCGSPKCNEIDERRYENQRDLLQMSTDRLSNKGRVTRFGDSSAVTELPLLRWLADNLNWKCIDKQNHKFFLEKTGFFWGSSWLCLFSCHDTHTRR